MNPFQRAWEWFRVEVLCGEVRLDDRLLIVVADLEAKIAAISAEYDQKVKEAFDKSQAAYERSDDAYKHGGLKSSQMQLTIAGDHLSMVSAYRQLEELKIKPLLSRIFRIKHGIDTE